MTLFQFPTVPTTSPTSINALSTLKLIVTVCNSFLCHASIFQFFNFSSLFSFHHWTISKSRRPAFWPLSQPSPFTRGQWALMTSNMATDRSLCFMIHNISIYHLSLTSFDLPFPLMIPSSRSVLKKMLENVQYTYIVSTSQLKVLYQSFCHSSCLHSQTQTSASALTSSIDIC